MEIANVCGEFILCASVGAVRHSKNGIDGFYAGLQEFFGYTVHIIFRFLGLCSEGIRVQDLISRLPSQAKQSQRSKAQQGSGARKAGRRFHTLGKQGRRRLENRR